MKLDSLQKKVRISLKIKKIAKKREMRKGKKLRARAQHDLNCRGKTGPYW